MPAKLSVPALTSWASLNHWQDQELREVWKRNFCFMFINVKVGSKHLFLKLEPDGLPNLLKRHINIDFTTKGKTFSILPTTADFDYISQCLPHLCRLVPQKTYLISFKRHCSTSGLIVNLDGVSVPSTSKRTRTSLRRLIEAGDDIVYFQKVWKMLKENNTIQ